MEKELKDVIVVESAADYLKDRAAYGGIGWIWETVAASAGARGKMPSVSRREWCRYLCLVAKAQEEVVSPEEAKKVRKMLRRP